MQTTLKQYPGFNLPQTMRGMTSNLEVEMVLMLGTMKMVVCKRSFLTRMTREFISNSRDNGGFILILFQQPIKANNSFVSPTNLSDYQALRAYNF
jgi:hypothetical protein